MTPFQRAYCRALGQEIIDPVPVEPDEVLEPLTAEQVNRHTREIEDEHFMILEPVNTQRRVLYATKTYGDTRSL